ncbi:MAG: ATP-binding protein [Bacteroidota bacterium]
MTVPQAMLIRPFFPNVILNLLTNAFKHGLATEMAIEIDGSKREVRVRENGKDMPDAMLPYIFNFRFSTGDEKNKGVGSFTEFVLTLSED